MNAERKINLAAYVMACLWFASCALCLVIGGKIGWSTKDQEIATVRRAQLEAERASRVDADIEEAQVYADSALSEIKRLYQGMTCIASWYGYESGKITASGAPYNPLDRTAAHRALPFGTIVFLERGVRYTVAKVTDRGPYIKGRQIDLSLQLARDLGMEKAGVAMVRMRVLHLPTADMMGGPRGDDGGLR